MIATRRPAIPVSHGALEAILQEPERPLAAAVVCHPHPLFGGTMDNNVTYRIAKTLSQAGLVALRFNFRGVGRSTGVHGGGIDEEEDVDAALAWLAARWPELPRWVGGFSFGARVGLAVGARADGVSKLLGVGLPLRMFDFGFLAASPKPKAIVQGSLDEHALGAEVAEFLADAREPKRFESVPGASHLFPGKLPELEAALARSVAFLNTSA